MSDFEIGQLIIYLVVLLFAVSAHEAAHAWMSDRFGDDTARLLGRVTLNPVAHTDPIGTLLLPIFSFIAASKGVFIPLLGWGKPTPVNPLRWRNKDVANVMVSLAGIMANTLIAICALVIIKVIQKTGWFGQADLFQSVQEPIGLLLLMSLTMNASLALFNLLPFPPLDGGKVLRSVLPSGMQPLVDFLEQYGFIILLAAMYFRVLDVIFAPVAVVIGYLLRL